MDASQEETKPDIEPEKETAEEDFKGKYFRMLAEMENMRKRMQKEKQEMTRFAVDNVLAELLPALDTFENALTFVDKMSDEVKNWAYGFQMILTQLKDILSQNGVSSFSAMGKHFDPHQHEAVEVEESDEHQEGMVIHEFMKGYKSGDRILRAARVKVSKKPKVASAQESAQEAEDQVTK